MLLPLRRLALDDILNTTLLLTLKRSRMTTLQEDQEEEDLVSRQVSHLICVMQQFSGNSLAFFFS